MPHADMEALGLLEESECLLGAILLGVGMQLRSPPAPRWPTGTLGMII